MASVLKRPEEKVLSSYSLFAEPRLKYTEFTKFLFALLCDKKAFICPSRVRLHI